MKKVAWKWKKMLLLTGMVSAMGLTVCACGDAKGEAGQEVPQGIEGEPISEEGDKSEDAVQEPAADEGGKDSGGGVAESEETAQSSEGKETDAWPDSAPDLKGDIKEIAEGQIRWWKLLRKNWRMARRQLWLLLPVLKAMIPVLTKSRLHMMKIHCLRCKISMKEERGTICRRQRRTIWPQASS